MKKFISLILISSLLLQVCLGSMAFAGEGVVQPETAQFKSVGSTNMVNLYTGDFSYNMPLLEVPGPEGNWPINMAYHAGVGPNSEATLVGLGWTLNPGSINRMMVGYPDDLWDGSIESIYEDFKGSENSRQMNWSFSTGPQGANITWKSSSGRNIHNTINNEESWWLKEKYRERSFGILHQLGFWATQADNPNGAYNLAKIWSEKNGNVYNRVRKYAEEEVKSYFPDNSQSSSDEANHYYDTKVERRLLNDILLSSQDSYLIDAEGISGTFRAFYNYPYDLIDRNNQNNGEFNIVNAGQKNTAKHITFRLDEDKGGTFSALANNWGDNLVADILRTPHQYGGHKILPAINTENGELLGFEVTTPDGKIYEYFRPVYSYYQYSASRSTGSTPVKTNSSTISSRYATSWLLTAVKGSDYVDKGTPGYSSDDWGFWMHFTYEESNKASAWRTPYGDGKWAPLSDSNWEGYSEGLKSTLYLKSIESATHIAQFHTSPRDDNQPSKLKKVTFAAAKLEKYTKVEQGDSNQYLQATFPFDRKFVKQLAGNLNGTLSAFYTNYKKHSTIWNASSSTCDTSITTYNNHTKSKNISLANANEYPDPDNSDGKWTIRDNSITFVNGKWRDSDAACGNVVYREGDVLSFTLKLDASNTTPNKLNTDVFARKLDKISIKKKKCHNNQKTDYDRSFAADNPTLESTDFWYDWSLIKNSPNSNTANKGKLTLKNIRKNGRNGYSYLPKTEFYYYKSNVNWSANAWDYWGGYTSSGTRNKHFNSQVKSTADKEAHTWNLSKIRSITGTNMTIAYESDEIHNIRQQDISKVAERLEVISRQNNRTFTISDADGIIKSAVDGGHEDFLMLEKETTVDSLKASSSSSCCPYSLRIPRRYYRVYSVKVASVANDTVRLKTPFAFQSNHTSVRGDSCSMDAPASTIPLPPGECFYNRDHSYTYHLLPSVIWAGGHRVKSITWSSGQKTNQKTLYKYGNGVSQILPSDYSQKFLNSAFSDNSLLANHGFNAFGPGPGVGYTFVESRETNKVGNIVKGKTITKFHTPDNTAFSTSTQSNLLKIVDKSNLYGHVKTSESYGLKEDTDGSSPANFFLIKKDQFAYEYSSQLPNSNDKRKIYDDSGNDITAANGNSPRLGFSQQKYRSNNQNDITLIDHQKENLFPVSKMSTVYFYDDNHQRTGEMTVKGEKIGYDAWSGNAIINRSLNAKGQQQINEMIPAYWKYSGLKDKNMLAQSTGTKSYLLPNNIAFDGLTATQKKQYLQSASVMTWKDWDNNLWRKNDTYKALKTGNNFVEFDYSNASWSNSDENHLPKEYDFLGTNAWMRTSNIIEYNRFSHVTEERKLNGSYVASIYGYDDALPVAIAKNARRSEISATSFENIPVGDFVRYKYPQEDNRWWEFTNGGNATIEISNINIGNYTGKQFLKLMPNGGSSNTSGIVLSSNANEKEFSGGKSYIVSAWVKSNVLAEVDISYKLNGQSYYGAAVDRSSGSGEWEYLETRYTFPIFDTSSTSTDWVKFHLQVPGESQSNTGKYAYFDEVRIRPVNATMSTFAYDTDTWKETSKTDPNNVVGFSEYDDAGRLLRKRDQDKHILSKYEYHYPIEIYSQAKHERYSADPPTSTINIRWRINATPKVDIYLQNTYDGSTTAIAYDHENNGSYSWRIPSSQEAGHYRIKISNSLDTQKSYYSKSSFYIAKSTPPGGGCGCNPCHCGSCGNGGCTM